MRSAVAPPDEGDLALHLLAAAVHASEAIDRLTQFVANHPSAGPAALANFADAVTTMTRIRTNLIRDADKITGDVRTSTS